MSKLAGSMKVAAGAAVISLAGCSIPPRDTDGRFATLPSPATEPQETPLRTFDPDQASSQMEDFRRESALEARRELARVERQLVLSKTQRFGLSGSPRADDLESQPLDPSVFSRESRFYDHSRPGVRLMQHFENWWESEYREPLPHEVRIALLRAMDAQSRSNDGK